MSLFPKIPRNFSHSLVGEKSTWNIIIGLLIHELQSCLLRILAEFLTDESAFSCSLFWIWINIIDQKAIETKLTQKKEQPIDFILYPMPESRKRAINHSNKNEHINDLNVWNGAALLVADCMGTGVSKK